MVPSLCKSCSEDQQELKDVCVSVCAFFITYSGFSPLGGGAHFGPVQGVLCSSLNACWEMLQPLQP